MGNEQPAKTFWIGLISVALLTAIAYWYWRSQFTQRQLPEPGRKSLTRSASQGGSIELEVRRKDDLTAIYGIGPVRAQQLHDAGVYAYEELARLTPDALRDLLGLEAWQGDVDGWLAQARELADSS